MSLEELGNLLSKLEAVLGRLRSSLKEVSLPRLSDELKRLGREVRKTLRPSDLSWQEEEVLKSRGIFFWVRVKREFVHYPTVDQKVIFWVGDCAYSWLQVINPFLDAPDRLRRIATAPVSLPELIEMAVDPSSIFAELNRVANRIVVHRQMLLIKAQRLQQDLLDLSAEVVNV